MASTATAPVNNFIDGELVEPADGRRTDVLNPATAEPIAAAADSTKEDVDRAVKAARAAFAGYSTLVPSDRSLMLLRFADAIEEHGDELAELEARNAGKPLSACATTRSRRWPTRPPLLRGRRAQPRGQGRRRVPRGLHVDGSGASRSAWSARSRRGTTR